MNVKPGVAGSLAAAVAISATALWVAPATGVETAKTTKCTFEGMTIAITPGMTTKTEAFKFRQATAGTARCDGPVLGKKVTGPGGWQASFGSFTGSCTGGKGEFTHQFEFPTSNGEVKLTNKGPFTFGPGKGGAIGGELDGDKMTGSFSVFPEGGNCVTRPVTRVSAKGEGTLR